MGANQSTVTPDQFKDHIFSIVLYYIAPKANPTLKFVTRDRCGPDFLPIPDEPDLTKLLNFYNPLDPQVSAYMHKHILNSEENMVRFYQTLIGSIRNTDDIPINHDGKLLNFASRPNLRKDPPDPLTRSRLGELDKPKRPMGNAGGVAKPDRTGTERPSKNMMRGGGANAAVVPSVSDTSRSSHFTMSKVVETANDSRISQQNSKNINLRNKNLGKNTGTAGGKNKNIGDKNVDKNEINFTNSELEETKQKLIVNLLKRAEPYQYHEDENYVEEDMVSDEHNSRKESREGSREESRVESRVESRAESRIESRKESREHSRMPDSRQVSRPDSRQVSRPDSRQVSRKTGGGNRDRIDSRLYNESSIAVKTNSKYKGYEESVGKKDEISVAPVVGEQFSTDMNPNIDIQDGVVVNSGANEDNKSRDDDHTSHPKEVYYDDVDEQTMKHKHRFREKCVIGEDFD